MGYATGEKAITDMLPYLNDILSHDPSDDDLIWTVNMRELRQLAHCIRQAMFAVRFHDKYEKYHKLRDQYQIRERAGWLEAHWKGPRPRKDKRDQLTKPEYTTLAECVGAAIEFEKKALSIFFKHATLTEDELLKLYTWAQQQDPVWNIINHESEGFTLSRNPKVDPVFYWKPKEEREE